MASIVLTGSVLLLGGGTSGAGPLSFALTVAALDMRIYVVGTRPVSPVVSLFILVHPEPVSRATKEILSPGVMVISSSSCCTYAYNTLFLPSSLEFCVVFFVLLVLVVRIELLSESSPALLGAEPSLVLLDVLKRLVICKGPPLPLPVLPPLEGFESTFKMLCLNLLNIPDFFFVLERSILSVDKSYSSGTLF